MVLNLLLLASLMSATLELMDGDVTKTKGLLDMNGSICELTTALIRGLKLVIVFDESKK